MTTRRFYIDKNSIPIVIPTIGGIFIEEQDTSTLKEDFSLRFEMAAQQFLPDKNSILSPGCNLNPKTGV